MRTKTILRFQPTMTIVTLLACLLCSVRVNGAATIQMQDVIGLFQALALRPTIGTGFMTGRAAVINAAGQIDGAAGNANDCVHVDGTASPCGSTGTAISFVDGEAPSGTINGANTSFALGRAPYPALSLQLFRNGVLMKSIADYTLSGNTVTLVACQTPNPGDVLVAYYRTQ